MPSVVCHTLELCRMTFTDQGLWTIACSHLPLVSMWVCPSSYDTPFPNYPSLNPSNLAIVFVHKNYVDDHLSCKNHSKCGPKKLEARDMSHFSSCAPRCLASGQGVQEGRWYTTLVSLLFTPLYANQPKTSQFSSFSKSSLILLLGEIILTLPYDQQESEHVINVSLLATKCGPL